MPKSVSYRPYKIESLKDPSYAAAYITAILEEKDPEPELLQLALTDVNEALSKLQISSEQSQLHQQKLNEIFSKQGSELIYNLVDWLNILGLKLTVTVNKEVAEANTVEHQPSQPDVSIDDSNLTADITPARSAIEQADTPIPKVL